MVNRYGYEWEYLAVTGTLIDTNRNPVAGTETWTKFQCDVQTSSGRFVAGQNGDKINVSYLLFTNVATGLVKGGKVRDESGKVYTVLNIHDYKLNYEIWV